MSKSASIKFCLIIFCQAVAISQNTIEVSGHFLGSNKGQRVSYFLPFDGYSNNSLPKYVFIKDSTGFFEIRDFLNYPGFIKVISGNRVIFYTSSQDIY